jgi:purine-cytosine permease-like protein
MPENLFTFESLGNLAGASLLTYLIVQYTKSLLDSFIRVPTDLYAVVVGSSVLLGSQLASGANAADWRLYALSLANGFLVAATAGKLNDTALTPPTIKPRKKDKDTKIL